MTRQPSSTTTVTSTPLTEALARYTSGTARATDVDLILTAYEPYITKYLSIVQGTYLATRPQALLTDDAVRVFAYSFKRGGDVLKTLHWVVDQCRRYTGHELRAEVIRSFLESLAEHGWARCFPSILAKNIAQLIGNQFEELIADVEYFPADEDECVVSRIPKAEQIFNDRGIVLTARERDLIRLLSYRMDLAWAARQLDISRTRAYTIFNRLKKKAQLF